MNKTAQHLHTGKLGEDLAVDFVIAKGFKVLQRNWRYRRCEVDIIASKENILHFFEVKTKTGLQIALPEANVSAKKLDKLKEAAEAYLFSFPEWKLIQFNVIAITLFTGRQAEIFFIEDVF